MDQSIFKEYDVRGIYPNQLNEEDTYKIAKAFFTFVINKYKPTGQPKIVLSYDGRLSSPSLAKEAEKALVESGAEVVNIGLSDTPTLYFSIYHFNYDAGMQISASHNAKEYNGIKLVARAGDQVDKISKAGGLDEIKEIATNGHFVELKNKGRVVKNDDVLQAHVENSFKIAGKPTIKHLKVVADPANATGALYLEALFERLPCELIKINFEIDGSFPSHKPDPSEFETLAGLQERVVKEKADFGIAPDGDSDRVYFVDEKGGIIPASVTTSIIAAELLKKHPGEKIGFDVRNTFNVLNALKENGGVPIINRIGNPYATARMKEEDCIFFGENSGHYLFRDADFMEDPIPVILIILSVLSRKARPFSEILKPYFFSCESPQINLKLENTEEVIKLLQEKYKRGKINFIDGLSADFPNWRFNVRPSNTEPVIRLNLEALNEKMMKEKRDELLKLIEGSLKKSS